MRRAFLIWLFFCMTVVFLLMLSITFMRQTWQARSTAQKMMTHKIDDVRKEIASNDLDSQTIMDLFTKQALSKAKTLTRMIQLEPHILDNQHQLVGLVHELDVDEIHVANKEGVLVASVPGHYVGYRMDSNEQSAPFMEAITNPYFELVQEPQPNGYYGTVIQYAGVARLDEPGIVQIAYLPERRKATEMITDIEKLAPGFRIGNFGKILICENDKIIATYDTSWIDHKVTEYGFTFTQLSTETGEFTTILRGIPTHCIFERYKNYLIVGTLPDDEVYQQRNSALYELIIANLLLFSVVFVVVWLLVDRIVISGIYRVNDSLKKITAGDLNEQVEVRSNSEFTLLSDGINTMVGGLREAIEREASRLDREIKLANSIQASAIPRIFPPFPDRNDFEIFASMVTAKGVGGDFYDFCLVDDDHLALVIADVSGKGIPAALFMMTAKTIVRSYVEQGFPPAEALTKANDHLCANNDTGMFVTLFLGIIELSTGRFLSTCAGHNPPLIRRNGQPYQWFESEGGLMLAAIEGLEYAQSDIQMQPGDELFLYTDGVTEAFNCNDETYGDPRLLKTLTDPMVNGMTTEAIVNHVQWSIESFVQGAVQSDDITMLAFQYLQKGKHGTK